MRDEREILLKVATPQEWRAWIERLQEEYIGDAPENCLFCSAYGWPGHPDGAEGCNDSEACCGRCMPEEYEGDFGPCAKIEDDDDKIDRAVQRLKDAGIWWEKEEIIPIGADW